MYIDNCKIHPTYNYKDQTKALYCKNHKKENMIDIRMNRKCIVNDCIHRSIYNYDGETKGLYCKTHKKDNMIDVKSKRCIEPNCKKFPIFNLDGNTKAIYCGCHKKEKMVDVKSTKCIEINCKNRPFYNYDGINKVLYCSEHKKENMINVTSKRCKTTLCYSYPNKKCNGYCLFCYIHIFPDLPITRNYKTKEKEVADFIKNTFQQYTWISDKKIYDGCSKRRPDLLLDLGYQIIIIEVDENQHQSYDCSCENKRLMEISLDLGHRPIIFIRFNPDKYLIDNTKIDSCWTINKNGISSIKNKCIKQWNERLYILRQQIEYWTDPINKTNKTLEVIELFFDNFELNNIVI